MSCKKVSCACRQAKAVRVCVGARRDLRAQTDEGGAGERVGQAGGHEGRMASKEARRAGVKAA
eukprot:365121-Chlamydomonas_euryale.AAC.1